LTDRCLVITEKPSAAKRIAEALDDLNDPEVHREKNVPYYVASHGDSTLIIVSALGHLYSIIQDDGDWTYPIYDYRWAPAHLSDPSRRRTKPFINVIEGLSDGIDEYVSACDYDMEGSLIAYNILGYACGSRSLGLASRMRFNTLTDTDLNRAWENRRDLDYPVIAAGKARHEIDWLFGINLSRALTLSVKNAIGRHRVLSIGRVQGPTLKHVWERELEIRSFNPTPFWIIKAETTLDERDYPLEYDEERLDTREKAKEIALKCRGKEGLILDIVTTRKRYYPPTPFNLGDLQREAYRHHRYNPRTALQAAEKLYLKAYISYPRTDSQYLPPEINIKGILQSLAKRKEYREAGKKLLSKSHLKSRRGKKVDPAHPAIHPTGKLPGRLKKTEYRIYDLICRRFLACLGEVAIREYIDARVDVGGYLFHIIGNGFLERGWLDLYGRYARFKEVPLHSLRKGMIIPITKIGYRKRTTKPPRRYTQISLLRLMEEKGLGTKATRTSIIGTLFKRGYIKNRNIIITPLGFSVIEILRRFCPEILGLVVTRELEQELEEISTGNKKADNIVEETIKSLHPILMDFKKHEDEIGKEITENIRKHMEGKIQKNILGECPTCKTGKIKIIKNRKTGKRFAGCTNYEKGCTQSYPLPQRGTINPTGKVCGTCGAPIVSVNRRNWNPWEICINNKCPTKEKNKDKGE
jgi:DNA topoisomerase-1